MMKIKLKKFSILEPKVKLNTGIKVITRESQKDGNIPLPSVIVALGTSAAITGHAEMEVL